MRYDTLLLINTRRQDRLHGAQGKHHWQDAGVGKLDARLIGLVACTLTPSYTLTVRLHNYAS